MSHRSRPSLILGFLTVRSTERGGVRGGYLLTTEFGRPIEFHYTSEIQIRGPQRLLYGPNGEETMEVELLGLPLTNKQSKPPQIVCVNRPSLLGLRRFVPAPVILFEQKIIETSDSVSPQVSRNHPEDLDVLRMVERELPPNFDWLEPFERLEQALAALHDPRSVAA